MLLSPGHKAHKKSSRGPLAHNALARFVSRSLSWVGSLLIWMRPCWNAWVSPFTCGLHGEWVRCVTHSRSGIPAPPRAPCVSCEPGTRRYAQVAFRCLLVIPAHAQVSAARRRWISTQRASARLMGGAARAPHLCWIYLRRLTATTQQYKYNIRAGLCASVCVRCERICVLRGFLFTLMRCTYKYCAEK